MNHIWWTIGKCFEFSRMSQECVNGVVRISISIFENCTCRLFRLNISRIHTWLITATFAQFTPFSFYSLYPTTLKFSFLHLRTCSYWKENLNQIYATLRCDLFSSLLLIIIMFHWWIPFTIINSIKNKDRIKCYFYFISYTQYPVPGTFQLEITKHTFRRKYGWIDGHGQTRSTDKTFEWRRVARSGQFTLLTRRSIQMKIIIIPMDIDGQLMIGKWSQKKLFWWSKSLLIGYFYCFYIGRKIVQRKQIASQMKTNMGNECLKINEYTTDKITQHSIINE